MSWGFYCVFFIYGGLVCVGGIEGDFVFSCEKFVVGGYLFCFGFLYWVWCLVFVGFVVVGNERYF